MFKKINTLKLFFEEPNREFNVREVARILKISPATASKDLKELKKEMVLTERKERMLNLYKADMDKDQYRDLKISYNIKKIRESGLIDSLNQFYLKPIIVLFGSSSFGMDIETSDIDLLIVSEKNKEFPDKKIFEKKLKKSIQIFAVKDIKELKNKHLINNIINGITIQGKIKWI